MEQTSFRSARLVLDSASLRAVLQRTDWMIGGRHAVSLTCSTIDSEAIPSDRPGVGSARKCAMNLLPSLAELAHGDLLRLPIGLPAWGTEAETQRGTAEVGRLS